MSTTARIPLVDESNLLVRAMNWYTRRTYGAVMEPALAMAHNRKVLMATMRYQSAASHWSALDASLKHLATGRSSRRSPRGGPATPTPTSSGGSSSTPRPCR